MLVPGLLVWPWFILVLSFWVSGEPSTCGRMLFCGLVGLSVLILAGPAWFTHQMISPAWFSERFLLMTLVWGLGWPVGRFFWPLFQEDDWPELHLSLPRSIPPANREKVPSFFRHMSRYLLPGDDFWPRLELMLGRVHRSVEALVTRRRLVRPRDPILDGIRRGGGFFSLYLRGGPWGAEGIGFSYSPGSQVFHLNSRGPLDWPSGWQKFRLVSTGGIELRMGMHGLALGVLDKNWVREWLRQVGLYLDSQAAWVALQRERAGLEDKVAAAVKRLALRNRQLREGREREKQWFLAINHDLRTPLTLVKGRLEMLREKLAREGTPVTQSLVPKIVSIEQSVSRMENLTENVLLYQASQISGPAKMPPPEVLAGEIGEGTVLGQALGEVLKQFSLALERRNLRPHLSAPGGATEWRLAVPRLVMERLLDNIFSNMEKYAADNSPLEIDIRAKGAHQAQFRFWNQAEPVTRSEAHQLLRLFGKTTVRAGRLPGRARGLGLVNCRNLSRRYGGDFRLLPARGGVCLQMRLPLMNETETRSRVI